MTGSADPTAQLHQECAVFTKYLSGQTATPYVQHRYRDGHDTLPDPGPSTFDRIVLALCRRSLAGVVLADAYTRWFRPHSLLRLKLTLVLAILENTPPYHASMTRCRTGSPTMLVLRLIALGAWYGATVATATLVLAPIHLATRLGTRPGQ